MEKTEDAEAQSTMNMRGLLTLRPGGFRGICIRIEEKEALIAIHKATGAATTIRLGS